MVAYALRMAAGASEVRRDSQAQFNWTKKGPRRSLLSVGRNAVSSGAAENGRVDKTTAEVGVAFK